MTKQLLPGFDPELETVTDPLPVKHETRAPAQFRQVAYNKLLGKAEELANRLLENALGEIDTAEYCPKCGRKREELQLKAVLAALDRVGLGPTSKIEFENKTPQIQWMEYLTDEQVLQLHRWMVEAIQRMPAGIGQAPTGDMVALPPGEIVEATVIEREKIELPTFKEPEIPSPVFEGQAAPGAGFTPAPRPDAGLVDWVPDVFEAEDGTDHLGKEEHDETGAAPTSRGDGV